MLFVIPAGPVSSQTFGPQNFAALMAATVAAVLAGVMLPFFCSFLLDGLVLLARGEGPRGLAVGALAVAVVAATALLLVFAGAAGSSSSTIFGSATALLVPWAVAAALVAFLIRQARQAVRRR